jgi:hypothetical protein
MFLALLNPPTVLVDRQFMSSDPARCLASARGLSMLDSSFQLLASRTLKFRVMACETAHPRNPHGELHRPFLIAR